MDFEKLKKSVVQKIPEAEFAEFRGELTARIPRDKLVDLMKFLKDDPELKFDYLTDLTGVDYLNMEREPRFDVVYLLYSFKHNIRFRVKVGVPEDNPEVASLTPLWQAANWLEREVFEMYGLIFTGHPDLRRLLTPDVFEGHPLRKDYPLQGKGERDVILDLK